MSGDGELMLTILASFAQEESKSVSDNCKWRIRKDFSEGKPMNLMLLYGYRSVDGQIVIDEDEGRRGAGRVQSISGWRRQQPYRGKASRDQYTAALRRNVDGQPCGRNADQREVYGRCLAAEDLCGRSSDQETAAQYGSAGSILRRKHAPCHHRPRDL